MDHAILPPSPPIVTAYRLFDAGNTFAGRGGVWIDDLSIAAGRSTAIVGRSGSGKSTLLDLLGGLLPFEAGPQDSQRTLRMANSFGPAMAESCWKGGDAETAAGAALSVVFQQPFLLREATGQDNLDMALSAGGTAASLSEIEALWTDLGLPLEDLQKPAKNFSGGMAQRLAVARALIRAPGIILADEPTASLDAATARDVMALLRQWQSGSLMPGKGERTLVFVTHSADLAAEFSDDLIVLQPPPGAGDTQASRTGRLAPGGWSRSTPKGSAAAEEIQRAIDGAPGAEPPAVPVSAATPASPANARPARAQSWTAALVWPRLGWAFACSGGAGSLTMRRWAAGFAIAAAVAFGLAVALPGAWRPSMLAVSALLLLAPLPLAMPRLSPSSRIRAGFLSVLLLAGMGTLLAVRLIEARGAATLRQVELNPILLSNGSVALTPGRIAAMERDLLSNLFPERMPRPSPSTYANHSPEAILAADLERLRAGAPPLLNPRYRTSVYAFRPERAEAEAPPVCNQTDGREARAMKMMGVVPAEPIGLNLRWRSVPDNRLDRVSDALRGDRWRPRGEPLPELVELRGDDGVSRVHINQDYLGVSGLRLNPDEPMPRWVCLASGGSGPFRPYEIAAIIEPLPSFEGEGFAFFVDEGMARGRPPSDDRRVTLAPENPIDTLAVRLLPDRVSDVLNWVREYAVKETGLVSERGFSKLERALDELQTMARIGHSQALMMGAVALIVSIMFVWQFVDSVRREMLVCRAFGAGFGQLGALCFTLLVVPLGVAAGGLLLFAALPGPFLVHVLAGGLGVADSFPFGPLWTEAAGVIAAAMLVSLIASVAVLLSWWSDSRALATRLREDG